jgi:hypothetical protein
MAIKTRLRKLALTAHVTASIGWFGALAVFLAHALTGLATQDVQALRASALAMDVTARFVILPLDGICPGIRGHKVGAVPPLLGAVQVPAHGDCDGGSAVEAGTDQ